MTTKFSCAVLGLFSVLGAGARPAYAQVAQRANQARQVLGAQQSTYQGSRVPARTTPATAARYRNNPALALTAPGMAAATGGATAATGGASVSGRATTTAARPVASMASMSGLRTGLTAFSADMGRLPTTAEGLGALITKPVGARNWRGPYVTQGPGQLIPGPNPFSDPWGQPYQYSSTTVGSYPRFEIRSAGPDGLLNTADDLAISG